MFSSLLQSSNYTFFKKTTETPLKLMANIIEQVQKTNKIIFCTSVDYILSRIAFLKLSKIAFKDRALRLEMTKLTNKVKMIKLDFRLLKTGSISRLGWPSHYWARSSAAIKISILSRKLLSSEVKLSCKRFGKPGKLIEATDWIKLSNFCYYSFIFLADQLLLQLFICSDWSHGQLAKIFPRSRQNSNKSCHHLGHTTINRFKFLIKILWNSKPCNTF